MSFPWLKSIYDSESSDMAPVHGIVSPADIRYGEPIFAALKSPDANLALKVRVWRLSPFGIEIVKTEGMENLDIGSSVTFDLNITSFKSQILGHLISIKEGQKNTTLYGFRFFDISKDEKAAWAGEERRKNNRWTTSLDFMPTGVCSNPGKFNDFIYFKIINISAGGMQVQSSLRNKFLISGMTLNATLSLPSVSNINVKFKIISASIGSDKGKDVLNLSCSFEDLGSAAKESIGQYIFQFGPPASLVDLKKDGLYVNKASRGVEYRFVRTKEDYDQVIELRRLAYSQAGKIVDGQSLSDIYDSRSRIVIGTHQGKVVSSLRLIFNELSDKMEHEEYVIFPNDFPKKQEICEITRVCTHPEYRGSDLLLNMFRFVSVTVAQSGRRYVLGCATNELLPMYTKLGFKATNIKYHYKALNNLEHTIFIGDIENGLLGEGVNPIVWNIVWKDVAKYLHENSVLHYTFSSRIRIWFYSLLGPLANFLVRPKRKK